MNLSATLDLYSNRKLHKRVMYQGLSISVENRAGTVRKGKGPDGSEWSTKMQVDYGYIKGTKGLDGGGVDCFVGSVDNAKFAYVVHIMKSPAFKDFDEDKVLLGFGSKKEAKKVFMAHYDNAKFYGGMDVLPMPEFKKKVLQTATKGPVKITATADGSPSAGITHMQPLNTFHPPSLKNPQRIPTDDPMETDDRFLDVTNRNNAKNESYRRSRTSNIGTDGKTTPVNTTAIGLGATA